MSTDAPPTAVADAPPTVPARAASSSPTAKRVRFTEPIASSLGAPSGSPGPEPKFVVVPASDTEETEARLDEARTCWRRVDYDSAVYEIMTRDEALAYVERAERIPHLHDRAARFREFLRSPELDETTS